MISIRSYPDSMFALLVVSACVLGIAVTANAQMKEKNDAYFWWQKKGRAAIDRAQGHDAISQTELQAMSKRIQAIIGQPSSHSTASIYNSLLREDLATLDESLSHAADKVKRQQQRAQWKITWHPSNHTATFIDLSQAQVLPLTFSKTLEPAKKAQAFIATNPDLFRLDKPDDELTLVEDVSDALGKRHIKFQQIYEGIPVWGHDIVIHLEADQNVYAVNAHAAPTPTTLSLQALNVSADDAVSIARSHLSLQTPIVTFDDRTKALLNYEGPVATQYVWVYDKTGQLHIIWHVQIRPNFTENWYYFIDAINGNILERYNATAHDGPTMASARDLQGNTRTLAVYEVSDRFYMIDASRPMFQPNQPDILTNPQGVLWTLDLQNNDLTQTSQLFHVSSLDNTWNDEVSVSAHYNVGQVFEYYFNTHGRSAIDGDGSTIISVIHVTEDGQSLDNAYWMGTAMVYGDGNQAFRPLAGGLDVAAHEMTHGVIQHTVNLEYRFQSGALNESFADIFGVMVDRDDWRIGEDVVLPEAFPSGAMRDMEDPHNGGTSLNDIGWQPAHMDEFVELTIDQDNGGVHMNSGIPNKACHLIGIAIGRDKTERIYYRILDARYLNLQSNFVDMRMAAIRAATDLYGVPSTEVEAVIAAFDAVGITEDSGTAPPAPMPPVEGTQWIAVINAEFPDTSLFLVRPVIQSAEDIVQLTGTQVFTETGNPIAVPDSGDFLFFIDSQNFIRFIRSDGRDEQVVSADGVWKSIALSPDGLKLAATTIMEDRTLFIFDLVNSANSKAVQLYTPTTGTNNRDDAVVFADTLDWDFSGQVVIYDAFNRIPQGEGGAIEYWDVNLLEVDSEVIVPLFPPQPEGTSIGNPSFGQTSDALLVFDFVDFNLGLDVIMAADLFRGTVNIIESNGDSIGYPRYAPDDRRLVFQRIVNNQFTVRQIPLADDSLQPAGPSEPYVIDRQHPAWFTIGSRPAGE